MGGRGGAMHGGAAGRGKSGQDWTPMGYFAQETTVFHGFQSMEDNCLECFCGSANKRNFTSSDGGAQRAVDNRIIRCLTAGRRQLYFLIAGQWSAA